MPIYEYECTDCGERVEHLQLSSDSPLTECAKCAGDLRKLMSAPAFQFKGTGWYVTDYAGKGKSDGASKDSASSKTPADKKSTSTDKAGSSSGSESTSSTSSTAKSSSPAD